MSMASLFSKLLGFMGARVAGALIGFASQLILARLFSVEDVGAILLAMSAAAFAGLAANGGYALLAMTQLPKLATHSRNGLREAFNSAALLDGLIALVVLAVVALVAALSMDLGHGQTMALVFGMLCAPASAFLRYNSVLANTERQYQLAYLPDFLFRPGLFLLIMLFAVWAGDRVSVVQILILFVALAYVTAFGQAKLLKGRSLSWRNLKWPRPAFHSRVRSRALALTLVSAVMFSFADIVTLVAGLALPEADVAIVGICVRLAAIAGFVLQAGQAYAATDLSQALMRRDEAAASHLLAQLNMGILFIIVAALGGAVLLGSQVLGLFGPAYVQGQGLLVLLLIGQSIRALGGMNQQILSLNGFQMRTAGACILALGVLVALTVILSGNFGIMAIGYAVIGAECVWLLALAAQAQSLCGRRGDLLWVLQKR